MLSSVPYLTPGLLLSLGGLMGRVSGALSGWQPAALQGGGHDWHPERGAAVLRRLVPGLAAFDEERRSALLRVCHADANDDNIVVSDGGQEAAGLIDFGDMSLMPRGDASALRRVLAAASYVMRVVPLSGEEVGLLPLLLRGRLAQSLTLGAASVLADPGNAAYLLTTQKPGWRLMRLLTPDCLMTESELLERLLQPHAP
ncbi:Hydroxylysine kinase [Tetrabaena socialis]|uniref:Hydroxylysine kinase n=1 Tax=Tetrabaena socialis TaxID=47790 RepID=A0A2J7ZWZ9_9CHLO|nr:Hydroxylysine kinase [Tetrabaena socialis]|eukprot:PNH04786.1 Hydroxylysine kinase [Tetrabaena socialis]